jgi:hypothetical protein
MRAMLAWGLLWAAIGVLAMSVLGPRPWSIQPSRASEMRASLSVIDHGGPALLGYEPGTRTPYAIGYADDQGIYVIVPELSHLLGQSDPVAVLRALWIVAWALTLLFSAAVFRALFLSVWAALLAPPTLLVCIFSFGFGDIYWVTAWVAVTLMPLLILLLRARPRHRFSALVAIALVAGVVTSIRSDAGLPVALAAAAVGAMAGGRRSLRAVVIAAVALAYLAPASIVLPAIRDHRDHSAGINLSANEPTSHPLWHSLYIGLGYTPNRYGVHYADRYAIAAVRELDPGVRYLSPAYASALHKQVDTLIAHDPGFVVGVESEKALVELSHAGRYLLLLALLLPAALAAQGAASLRRRELALFLPALLIGSVPAIVAVPFRDYELTLLGPLGVLGVLAIGSTAARAEGEWVVSREAGVGPVEHARLALRRAAGAWATRATARALLVTLAVLVPAFAFARHFEAEHARWERSAQSAPTVVLAAAPASTASPRS